ncbi:MAG: hypothetical protein JWN86_1345 [Planctomycetota bacterium]|nr:hypothetical protein [Planctomycetota bacterium]
MKTWKKVLLVVFVVVALGAGVCAVAGINPLNLLACDPGQPNCGG